MLGYAATKPSDFRVTRTALIQAPPEKMFPLISDFQRWGAWPPYENDVTWSMHGPSPYVAKLIGIFLDLDRMIGTDFETCLANLKSIAEA